MSPRDERAGTQWKIKRKNKGRVTTYHDNRPPYVRRPLGGLGTSVLLYSVHLKGGGTSVGLYSIHLNGESALVWVNHKLSKVKINFRSDRRLPSGKQTVNRQIPVYRSNIIVDRRVDWGQEGGVYNNLSLTLDYSQFKLFSDCLWQFLIPGRMAYDG